MIPKDRLIAQHTATTLRRSPSLNLGHDLLPPPAPAPRQPPRSAASRPANWPAEPGSNNDTNVRQLPQGDSFGSAPPNCSNRDRRVFTRSSPVARCRRCLSQWRNRRLRCRSGRTWNCTCRRARRQCLASTTLGAQSQPHPLAAATLEQEAEHLPAGSAAGCRRLIRRLKVLPRRLRHIDGSHRNRFHLLGRWPIQLPPFEHDHPHGEHHRRSKDGRKRWHRISPTGGGEMRGRRRESYWPRFPARNGGFA